VWGGGLHEGISSQTDNAGSAAPEQRDKLEGEGRAKRRTKQLTPPRREARSTSAKKFRSSKKSEDKREEAWRRKFFLNDAFVKPGGRGRFRGNSKAMENGRLS